MNRSLSFGYNAVAALGEIVADRLVKALFEDGTINEIITSSFNLGNIIGTIHGLLSNPVVEFSAGANDRLWLQLDVHAVLQIPAPSGLFGLADGDWLKAQIRVKTQLAVQGTKLIPNFTKVSAQDIFIQNVTSNNPSLGSVASLFMANEMAKVLSTPVFSKLEVDPGFNPGSLQSNSMDIAVMDGPPPEDHDELALAFYHSSNIPQTRGNKDGIQTILGAGKSFTVRVSSEAFYALIKEEIDQQFLRFDLKLGDTKEEKKYKVTWGETSLLLKKFGLAFGNYDMRLLADPKRANLRNCTVKNLRTGDVMSFDTNSKGESTNWVILYSEPEPIFMDDLKTGDVLRFFGEYKLEKNVKLFYPSFKLDEGCINLSAKAVADIVCYDDVTAYLNGNVYLSIDPATGELAVSADEPEIDLPWYVDTGLALLKGVLYAFTGPLASLIISGYEDTITSQLEQQVKNKSSLLLPSISGNSNMRLFWEDIQIKTEGIILQGQIEAGWLKGGGRSLGLVASLDSESWVNFNQPAGYVSLSAYNIPPDLDDSAVAVVNNSIPFEQLGQDDLKQMTSGKTTKSVGVPVGDSLEGVVLAVRTALGKYAKIRVDRSKTKQWVLRWITYNTPAEPGVTITGSLQPNKDKSAYKGKFKVKSAARIYEKYGMDVKWNYSGPGKATLDSDANAIWVEVDFNKDQIQTVWFLSKLEVQVTDIFGRTAKAELQLSGTYGEEYGRPLPEQKREPGPGDDGDLLEWVRNRGLVNPRIRQIIRFARAIDNAGLSFNEPFDVTTITKRLLVDGTQQID